MAPFGDVRGTPFGYARFMSQQPNLELLGLVTPGVIKIIDGYAKIETVDLAKRKSRTEFAGMPPWVITVPVLFNGFLEDRSVEPHCGALSRMATAPTKGSTPPEVVIEAPLPYEVRNVASWWISGLAWGENVIMNPATRERVRQDVVVTMTEYLPGKNLVPTTLPPLGRVHTVHKGEQTLALIAKHYTRTAAQRTAWIQIVRRRNTITPGAVLKVGRRLQIP